MKLANEVLYRNVINAEATAVEKFDYTFKRFLLSIQAGGPPSEKGPGSGHYEHKHTATGQFHQHASLLKAFGWTKDKEERGQNPSNPKLKDVILKSIWSHPEHGSIAVDHMAHTFTHTDKEGTEQAKTASTGKNNLSLEQHLLDRKEDKPADNLQEKLADTPQKQPEPPSQHPSQQPAGKSEVQSPVTKEATQPQNTEQISEPATKPAEAPQQIEPAPKTYEPDQTHDQPPISKDISPVQTDKPSTEQSAPKLPGNFKTPKLDKAVSQQPLNANEKAAVKAYTGMSAFLNRDLWNGKGQGDKDLDSAIAKGTLQKDSLLMRYPRGDLDALINAKPGQTFENKGYTSTTVDTSKAQYFNEGVLLRIHAPKGMNATLGRALEGEVLLPRGITYRVRENRGKIGKVHVVDVDAIQNS